MWWWWWCKWGSSIISINSTSKIVVAFGGITLPAPRLPHPNSGGIINVAFAPTFSSWIPSSHPGITLLAPKINSIGSLSIDESNCLPSRK